VPLAAAPLARPEASTPTVALGIWSDCRARHRQVHHVEATLEGRWLIAGSKVMWRLRRRKFGGAEGMRVIGEGGES
jgi:hypothetical protein